MEYMCLGRLSDCKGVLYADQHSGLFFAGSVDYRHMFLDMSSVTVEASNFTRAGRTCRAAMGFSFAAGTTDGALPMHRPPICASCHSPVRGRLCCGC